MSIEQQREEAGSARPPPVDHIAGYLSANIRSGLFEAGSRLPTEQMLSRRFDVSRTVVREAISRLKSDGLVNSRQGSGVYVTSSATRLSFKVAAPLLAGSAEVLALLELRQPVEMAAARLAATRRTDESLARIAAAQEAMRCSDDWSEAGVIADLEFHHAVARATDNLYYADFMAFLGGVMRVTIATARSSSGEHDIKWITAEEHSRILDAIAARNPEDAALAMMAHLQGARERMKL